MKMVFIKVSAFIGTLFLLLFIGPTYTSNSIFYIFNYSIILILKNNYGAQIQDKQTHLQLQHDPVEHIWQRFGSDS